MPNYAKVAQLILRFGLCFIGVHLSNLLLRNSLRFYGIVGADATLRFWDMNA